MELHSIKTHINHILSLLCQFIRKSSNVHVLILGNFEYAILHGNREFGLQMKLRLLVSWGEIGRLPWIVWVDSKHSHEDLL